MFTLGYIDLGPHSDMSPHESVCIQVEGFTFYTKGLNCNIYTNFSI